MYSLQMRDGDHDRSFGLLEPLLQIFGEARPEIDREAVNPRNEIARILKGPAGPEMARLVGSLKDLGLDPKAFLEAVFAVAGTGIEEVQEGPVRLRFENRLAAFGGSTEPSDRREHRSDDARPEGTDATLALDIERNVAAGLEARLAELGLAPAGGPANAER